MTKFLDFLIFTYLLSIIMKDFDQFFLFFFIINPCLGWNNIIAMYTAFWTGADCFCFDFLFMIIVLLPPLSNTTQTKAVSAILKDGKAQIFLCNGFHTNTALLVTKINVYKYKNCKLRRSSISKRCFHIPLMLSKTILTVFFSLRFIVRM